MESTVALQEMLHSVQFLLFRVELQQLYRKCHKVSTFPTISCRATAALQEILHSVRVSYDSTGDATQCVDFELFHIRLQQLYRRCYTVCTFPTNPRKAAVALQEILHSVRVSCYCLQSYNSSTGDATHCVRTVPCRATEALQEMLYNMYISYYSLQSYSSSTGDAIQCVCVLCYSI